MAHSLKDYGNTNYPELFFIGQEDFFIVLNNMLAGRPEVSGIHCVKDAKVPLLHFTFEGILIDLAFAKLQVTDVPEVSRNDTLCVFCIFVTFLFLLLSLFLLSMILECGHIRPLVRKGYR